MLKTVIKQNIMLLLITIVLLVFTAFLWLGIPIYIIGGALVHTSIPFFMQAMIVNLCMSIIASLYFVWIPVKYCKVIYDINKRLFVIAVTKIQCGIIVVIFVIVFFMPYIIFILN